MLPHVRSEDPHGRRPFRRRARWRPRPCTTRSYWTRPATEAKYNDKVVQVNGTVRDITAADDGRTNVLLETGDALGAVVCSSPPMKIDLQKNDPVRHQGLLRGVQHGRAALALLHRRLKPLANMNNPQRP